MLRVQSELQAFLDESGTHFDSKECVIAGYVATTTRWSEFETRWQCALAEAGVPDFHAKVFFARDENGGRVAPYAAAAVALSRHQSKRPTTQILFENLGGSAITYRRPSTTWERGSHSSAGPSRSGSTRMRRIPVSRD